MKRLFLLSLLLTFAGGLVSLAQCDDYAGNINNLPVCGLYGDASGNSTWNWELTDINDPSFCQNWYARTGQTTELTPMSSPFVNSQTDVLDLIAQKQDFTRAKGWELLRRDFGCSHIAPFPYFVLYNKYTGLMRLFIYVTPGNDYSGIAAEIKPNAPNKIPATTAFIDTIEMTPDKYVSTSVAAPAHGLVSIGELAGQGAWSMIEFTTSFDPNIQHQDFTGALLEFSIYGVLTNNMHARIRGGSVTSQTQVHNYTYKPENAPELKVDGTYDFKAVGEQFTRISSSATTIRTEVKNMAEHLSAFFANSPDSLEKNIKKKADILKDVASNNSLFLESIGTLAEAVKAFGSAYKIFTALSGIFSASGASSTAPTYTTYDLELQGTINTRLIINSFVVRVPGTIQNDNSNATYYRCPLGIVNIKNTPLADKITYNRTFSDGGSTYNARLFASYKIKNDLIVSFNDGAGLDLVSAQAAFVGEIPLHEPVAPLPYSLLDPFIKHGGSQGVFNHLRADLESGRLELKQVDNAMKRHVFQTPYVNIECLNGLAFNVPAETKVYLQVKIVLKQSNDPTNTPIIFINNYNIETTNSQLNNPDYILNARNTLPPFRNYTELPLYVSNFAFGGNQTFNSTNLTKADYSITTNNKLITVNSGANVIFSAGGAVHLEPGFEAVNGSLFEAKINDYGFTLTCNTLLTEAYVHPSACYNTSAQGVRMRPTDPPAESQPGGVKIYPVPAPNIVHITGISSDKNSVITLIDQSGRTIKRLQVSPNGPTGTISVDVSGLSNGVYFIRIQATGGITTRKIIVGK